VHPWLDLDCSEEAKVIVPRFSYYNHVHSSAKTEIQQDWRMPEIHPKPNTTDSIQKVAVQRSGEHQTHTKAPERLR